MTGVVTQIVIDALVELADEEVQCRRWTATHGPEVGSFTEAVSHLLDDSGLGDALDIGKEVYGAPADGLLAELAVHLTRIDGSRSPEVVLADRQMDQVRRLAAVALALIGSGQRSEEWAP
ncbi:MAG: hypothetical protein ACT4OS_04285 [Acidimicrobiales bacterium]